MDERLRFVARLLDGEKMAPLCAEFGISRKPGYKIYDRYKGIGVQAFTDRSRRPYRQANRLPAPIAWLCPSNTRLLINISYSTAPPLMTPRLSAILSVSYGFLKTLRPPTCHIAPTTIPFAFRGGEREQGELMRSRTIGAIDELAILATLLLLPTSAAAQVRVHCDDGGSLQRAVNVSNDGDRILVSGTCRENVIVPAGKHLVTLDGGGTATISGTDPTSATLSITGRDITIQAFTVTGGQDGIEVSRGGSATIDGNIIHETGNFGISLVNGGSATIVNNTVQDNANAGVAVSSNSSAWIGFVSFRDTAASPNVITRNGQQGIVTRRGASAVIIGNDISDNMGNGVRVTENSYARLSANTINHNRQNGVLVEQGSGVVMAPPPPPGQSDNLLTQPNSTSIANLGFAVRCQIGGYTDGRLGTLSGASGPEFYSEGCIDSLIQ